MVVLAIDDSSWLDRAQYAFHFPLLAIFTLIFIPRINLLIFGILAVLSYVIAWNGWIDESLYYFLNDQGLLSALSPERGIVNPQYVKLILYFIGLVALMPLVLIKKFRTEDRLFGFLGVLACMAVTFLIHKSIPAQTLAWERGLIKENMQRLLVVADTPSRFEDICASFSLKCFVEIDESRLSDVSGEFETQELLRYQLTEMRARAQDSTVFEHGYFDEGEWRRQIFSIRSTGTQKMNIAIEEEQINKSQQINEESFGRLAFAAYLVWGWLFLLVGIAHRSSWKSKIFSKTEI